MPLCTLLIHARMQTRKPKQRSEYSFRSTRDHHRITDICVFWFLYPHYVCAPKKKKKISIMTGLCLLSGFDGGDVSKVASLQQATETPFISLG